MEHSTFYVVGIEVRTTNENGQSAKDIPELWGRFFQESILKNIPNKIDSTIYSVYIDYESDFTKPYTTLIGCKVPHLNAIPKGMVGKAIPGGNFVKYTALGKGAVFTEWTKIWNTKLDRKYTADYEVYSEKAQMTEDGEVNIFIAVK